MGSPFASHNEMYDLIDAIKEGDVPWQSMTINWQPEDDAAGTASDPDGQEGSSWKLAKHEVWFRDPRLVVQGILSNPDFNSGFDPAPCQVFNQDGNCIWSDFMTGNWTWDQCVSTLIYITNLWHDLYISPKSSSEYSF